MGYAEYNAYLKSDHWKKLRRSRAAFAGAYRCEECGSGHKVEGHHLRYKNLTDCTIEDIVLLCQPCHAQKHSKAQSVRAKARNVEKAAQRKRWRNTVNSMVRVFRKKTTPETLDDLIAELIRFRVTMK